MAGLQIAQTIFERFPDLRIGVLRATLPSTPADRDGIEGALSAGERAAREEDGEAIATELAAWREAYRWFGAKPKKQRCAAEALRIRIKSGGQLPRIMPIVDLYNGISLKTGLPIGGDDLAHVEGEILLTYATGEETFTPAGGGDPSSPRRGEVIYRDAGGILCRRWNWREGDRTALREDSRDILLYVETLGGDSRLAPALDELQNSLETLLGASVKRAVLAPGAAALRLDDWVVWEGDHPGERPVRQAPPERGQQATRKKRGRGKRDKGFWADRMAREILQRIEETPRLQDIVSRQGILIYDEKTPSGSIHIGSGRGWILHDVMARALREQGADAHFVLSSDDMDPYDKPSAGVPRDLFDRHLGKPFRHIPSPVEGYRSFGDYYFSQCTELFGRFSIEAELEETGALYEDGSFDPAIQRVLDQTEQVQGIYTKLYGDTPASHRLPFSPLCECCGRIGTTRATGWDGARGMIQYECRSDIMSYKDPKSGERTYIAGCGHVGERSPFRGGGKFPWKIEWAAKWFTKGVIAEWAGKDHFSAGGSRTAACHFSVDVFDFPPPYPSSGYRTGDGYEFLNVAGRKMSTSKGAGVGFAEVSEALSPSMLRFLMLRARPNQVIDFDPNRDGDLLLLYNNHDRTEREAQSTDPASEGPAREAARRTHHFTYPGAQRAPHSYRLPFRLAALVGPMTATAEEAVEKLAQMGHVPEGAELEALERVREARAWLRAYAPDSGFRLELNSEPPDDLEFTAAERAVFSDILACLSEGPSDEQLTSVIFRAIKTRELQSKVVFQKAYQLLLGKSEGPALSPFLLSMGDRALPLLRAATEETA